MTHPSSFGIATSGEFFREIVLPHYQDFIANNASPRHALATTIMAYHLYEWVHHTPFTLAHFQSVYPAHSALAEIFELARKITNGTKHFEPRANTRRQRGFSSGFSDAFARPLMAELPSGNEVSADLFLRQMLDFWTEQQQAGAF